MSIPQQRRGWVAMIALPLTCDERTKVCRVKVPSKHLVKAQPLEELWNAIKWWPFVRFVVVQWTIGLRSLG